MSRADIHPVPTSPSSTSDSSIANSWWNQLHHRFASASSNIRHGYEVAKQSLRPLRQYFQAPTPSTPPSTPLPTPKSDQPFPPPPPPPTTFAPPTRSSPFHTPTPPRFGPLPSHPNSEHSLASLLQPPATPSSAFNFPATRQFVPFENHTPFSYGSLTALRRRHFTSPTVTRPTPTTPLPQAPQPMDLTMAHQTPRSGPRTVYRRNSFCGSARTAVIDPSSSNTMPATTRYERRRYPTTAVAIPSQPIVDKVGSTASGRVEKRVRGRCQLLAAVIDRNVRKFRKRKHVIVLESRKGMAIAEEPDPKEEGIVVLERTSRMKREELEAFLLPEEMDLLKERPDLYEKFEKSYEMRTGGKVFEARRKAAERKEKMKRVYQDLAMYEAKEKVRRSRLAEFEGSGEAMEEEAPEGEPHYDEVYWSDDDDWEEDEDNVAMEERRKKRTVVNEDSMFSPLTNSALKRLRRVMSIGERTAQQLANVNGCIIGGADIARLKPGLWLNDEIVNAYLELLVMRANDQRVAEGQSDGKMNGWRKNGKKRFEIPSFRVVNSFFYSSLVKFNRAKGYSVYDYTRVKRWTRRFDVFANDFLLIPINQQNTHWTLGVVNFKDKTVMHLDSMGNGGSAKVCENLLKWVRDEAADKRKGRYVENEWSMVSRPDVPKQQNSDDCGVFVCKFADCLTRGWARFTFDQRHMDYFRSRIAHELLMGRAT